MGLEEFIIDEQCEGSIEQQLAEHGDMWKEGRAAKHERGIVYKAPWETQHDGVCIAARRHARALRMTGVPVFLQSDSFTHSNLGVVSEVEYFSLPGLVRAEVDGITQVDHGQSLLLIRHCVPTRGALEALVYPPVMRLLNHEQLTVVRKAMILFSAFETDKLDEDAVRYMNMLGRVWVTCDKNKQWLSAAGVDEAHIVVVPHPFYGKDPMAQPRTGKRTGLFRFLNVSKWEPRKAQHDLIGGFLLAFGPADDAELVLKCNPFARVEGYPADWQASIEQWAANEKVSARWTKEKIYERVKVLWKAHMTRAELAQLYRECDVYVSTGRAEGFDLPAFDAKLSGMRMIHAASGGPEMFHQPGVDVLIDPTAETQPFHPIYNAAPDARWCGFDATHVSHALMAAYACFRDPIPAFDRSRYTMKAVGAVMRQSCNELLKEHGTDISNVNVDASP
ncbi:MAG: hypothetical protein WC683_02535 [bacterium]